MRKQSIDHTSMACIIRMASSFEKMLPPVIEIMEENKQLVEDNYEQWQKIKTLERSIKALKGHLTRLKSN